MLPATTPLIRPIHIGKRIAKNRFMIQPMECNDGTDRGRFTSDTLERYHALYRGGAGTIVMESVTLQYESRARRNQLLLDVDDPENRAMWDHFVREKKIAYPNTLLLVQLNHSGELSDSAFSRRVCVKPLTGFGGDLIGEDYIQNVIDQYVRAAQFLSHIGVDGVDLKFCHGYLGSQILRPYNDRVWKYGGSFANRSRFAYELCEKVRHAVPDESFLIGAKISMYDEMVGGQGHAGADSRDLDIQESIALCKGLEARGAGFFIESLGSAGVGWNMMCPTKQSSQNVLKHLETAKLMRRYLRPETTVVCGGLSLLADGKNFSSHELGAEGNTLFYQANAGIQAGNFDMIALGRQSLADPLLPEKYMEEHTDQIDWCRCCNRCAELEDKQQHGGCALYNSRYRKLYQKICAPSAQEA